VVVLVTKEAVGAGLVVLVMNKNTRSHFFSLREKKIREKFREKLERNYDSRVIVFSFGYLVQKNKISGCKKLKKKIRVLVKKINFRVCTCTPSHHSSPAPVECNGKKKINCYCLQQH
jgi:hypothetical protein